MRKYAIAATAVAMFGAAPAFADEAGTVEYGRVLVLENCSTCHATGVTGESTHPDAPPFRRLSRYVATAVEKVWKASTSPDRACRPS